MVYIIAFMGTFFAVYHLVNSFKFKSDSSKCCKFEKGISMLIPCYNEEAIIENTIDGLANIDYKNYEVIFINDGSTDNTMDVLREKLKLIWKYDNIYESIYYKGITVIDKENGGKADSLNVGINHAKKELVCTLDADCILHKDALRYINASFQDEDTIAVGGVVKVLQMFRLNKKAKLLVRLQALEFIRGFYIYKSSLAYNNALAIISGAFGVFKKYDIEKVGGFRDGLGEDIDITLRMQEYAKINGKKVKYNLNAVCYTECPETLKDLTKQRIRWQKAFVDGIINNKKFLFSTVFTRGLAFHVIIDSLISSTLSNVLLMINSIYILIRGFDNLSKMVLVYCLMKLSFHIIYSIIAIIREKNYGEISIRSGVIGVMLIDIICYRFINALYFIFGTILYFFNSTDWNKVERTNHKYDTGYEEVRGA